jgi:hypothetical protein
MAATHILVIGRITKSHTSLRVAPHNPEVAAQLNAYLERGLCEAAFEEFAAAEADDYEDYLDEIDWIRHGC